MLLRVQGKELDVIDLPSWIWHIVTNTQCKKFFSVSADTDINIGSLHL